MTRDDEDFATLLRVQATCVQTVMTTQARVDEARLKRRQEDRLPAILARLLAEEHKLQASIRDLVET